MRVLVCGGRDYEEVENGWENLIEYIAELNTKTPISTLINGGARGADSMAAQYARCLHIPVKTYDADWNKYGKKAGYLRNKQMLEEGKPDLVVAFPGGKGTAMMVKVAKEAGVEVVEVT